MDENLRGQIKESFQLLESDELLEIWKTHNTDDWTDEAFIVLREVLFERLGSIPEISTLPSLHQISDRIKNLRNQKAFSSALFECEKAIDQFPENPKVHYYQGLTLKDMGELEKALPSLLRAVQLDPEFKDAAQTFKSVEKELDRHFENSPAKDHLDQAIIHAEDEEVDLAMREIDLARASLPELANAYTCLGEVLMAVNELDEAIEIFQKAISFNPDYSKAHTGLRNARVMQDEAPLFAETTVDRADEMEVENLSAEFDEKKFDQQQDEIEETPGWVYMDKQALLVKGSAGHRNRPGRSGLDPLDNQMDAYRLEGGLIRRLFTGHLRTRDPLYIVLMTILGIIFALPLLFFLGSLGSISTAELINLFPLSIVVVCGLALLINVGLSFVSEEPEDIRKKGGKFF